ncbi:hypothetical protein CYMTET_18680 [Cymbomonas tetramitiformis]|uniref:RING-type domain-containing protein n=1 Tax=Cymbomonas tetramitiformis TaxID=36881 RepID=A0AAE0G7K8_9CHLO|nr:hypothetical protein CYMTET_18680 [Cymbomonas tetramitiformis]
MERTSIRASLVSASRKGDAAVVRRLMSGGSNSGDREHSILDNDAVLALNEACNHGHASVVKELLEHDTDPNVKNSSGNTPLHRASEMGNIEVVELLMKHGAKLNTRNHEGKTPIAVARNAPTRRVIAAEVDKRAAMERQRRTDQMRRALSSPVCNRRNTDGCGNFPSMLGLRSPLAELTKNATPASPGTKMHSDMMEQLTCVICLRLFCSEENTGPVSLPCGHNFCRECVIGLKGESGPSAQPFRCPLDRTVFPRTLELRVNTTLRDLIQKLSVMRLKPSPVNIERGEGSSKSPMLKEMCDVATSPLVRSEHHADMGCSPVSWRTPLAIETRRLEEHDLDEREVSNFFLHRHTDTGSESDSVEEYPDCDERDASEFNRLDRQPRLSCCAAFGEVPSRMGLIRSNSF